ncbi:MAG: BsuPI-related putative proteinase inhibitor, partial [Candidatus Methylomirabilales bacterium]
MAIGLLVSPACGLSPERDLNLAVSAGDRTFKTGQPIPLELVVRYGGKDPLTLNFSTSQRYDFQIEKEGEILWRWSDGRMFAQVVGQFSLSSELPQVRYRALFQGRLPPGQYKARGLLTTRPRPLSAATRIT